MANEENLIPAKKGEIRNPTGKKKGTKNFKTIYKKVLSKKFKVKDIEIDIPFVDQDQELTLKEMIVLRHVKKALGKADTRDVEMIINRQDGLLTQKIDSEIKMKSKISIVDLRQAYEKFNKEEKKDDDKRED